METIEIPLELFNELIGNTLDCLNNAISKGNERLEKLHQAELDKCNKLIKSRLIK